MLAGNIKGLQDPYRTPETQKGFAENIHQKPRMVTSFADGTKISMEMAVVANATGHPGRHGGACTARAAHVKDALALFPLDQCSIAGSSTTSSARNRALACSCSGRTSTQSRAGT